MNNIWRVLLIVIFCLPKINLVEVDNFNAGIRIDDIFIAGFAMIYAAHVVLAKKLSITPAEKAFFLFLAVITLGTGFNALFFDRGSVLFLSVWWSIFCSSIWDGYIFPEERN